jgi:hypothetical protein
MQAIFVVTASAVLAGRIPAKKKKRLKPLLQFNQSINSLRFHILYAGYFCSNGFSRSGRQDATKKKFSYPALITIRIELVDMFST